MARSLMTQALAEDLSAGVPGMVVYGVTSRAEAEGLRVFWPFTAIVNGSVVDGTK
jgi:hypothetical protein